MQPAECFICRKQRGEAAPPPGGYVLVAEHWMVCHAPVDKGPLGTLFIEARRHVLDFADFNDDETASFGALARRVYASLRVILDVDRVYQLSMMEGVPHFHAWIVPRTVQHPERGLAFLAKDITCAESDARRLAASLRGALS